MVTVMEARIITVTVVCFFGGVMFSANLLFRNLEHDKFESSYLCKYYIFVCIIQILDILVI